ncbi:CehA/McbA family metallohydrolase [Actinomyces sp. MRS3W]|uniref:CehA/McbA family metallohydrolase n=1 Tax=Actinomyces sp. MRS3W TaxID=2800796 RepID=UPI0028FD78E3|nr:CehA/McbA family metallohydrolase [Actinomyces sp. MRS3W]MDU0349428.1 CehA/McbA family metallohydrolase [Actinomyces sp. MRS3W]
MTLLQHTTLHLTLADQAVGRYPQIPFELPQHPASMEVKLAVEGGAKAVIDLGLLGPDGLRGWSGAARTGYVVEMEDATPGYRPGLEPGTWAVLLGLHQLPADGVDVSVTVLSPATMRPDHGPSETPVRRRLRGSDRGLPAPPGLTWYAGDPHSHSLHSDGDLSLWELANEAVTSGLDYLGCTEHNTVSHHPHLAAVGRRHGVTLIPGQEITTHRGHANAWGPIGVIDFRQDADTWALEVERRGGFLSINHPVDGDCAWLHPLPPGRIGTELYHGSAYRNLTTTAPLAWAAAGGRSGTIVGGGDFHNRSTPLRPGMPTTWIAAEECTAAALVAAMAAGRTTITASARLLSPEEARPVLLDAPALVRLGGVAGYGDEDLMAVDAAGTVLVDGRGERLLVSAGRQVVHAPRERGPFRLETADRWIIAQCA